MDMVQSDHQVSVAMSSKCTVTQPRVSQWISNYKMASAHGIASTTISKSIENKEIINNENNYRIHPIFWMNL